MLKRVWYYWCNIVLGIILWQLALSLLLFTDITYLMMLGMASIPFTISMIGTGAVIPSFILAYRENRNARNG